MLWKQKQKFSELSYLFYPYSVVAGGYCLFESCQKNEETRQFQQEIKNEQIVTISNELDILDKNIEYLNSKPEDLSDGEVRKLQKLCKELQKRLKKAKEELENANTSDYEAMKSAIENAKAEIEGVKKENATTLENVVRDIHVTIRKN